MNASKNTPISDIDLDRLTHERLIHEIGTLRAQLIRAALHVTLLTKKIEQLTEQLAQPGRDQDKN